MKGAYLDGCYKRIGRMTNKPIECILTLAVNQSDKAGLTHNVVNDNEARLDYIDSSAVDWLV